MKHKFNGTFSYKKDLGKVRISNEDESKILINSNGDLLMVVTDGMGGANKGDFASLEVINALTDAFKKRKKFYSTLDCIHFIRHSLKIINKKLYDLSYSDANYKGMGTTIILAFLYNNNLIIANAGDSRCYILSKKEFK